MIIKSFIRKTLQVAALVAVVLPLSPGAQNITSEQIKAQYVLKMRPFILLGTPPRTIRKICYYEKSGVSEGESVGQSISKYLQSHPAKAGQEVSVKVYRAIREFSGCDVLYIPSEEESNIDNILAALGNSETLTISGAPRFIYRGGMIGFVLDEENRVKMEANIKNTKEKNINIRAEMLELMQKVISQ